MHPVLHRDPHQPYHLTRLDVRLTGSQPPAIDDWLDSLAQSFSYRFVFRIDVDAINVRDGVTCLAGAVNWFARQGKLFLPHCLVHVRAHSASESAAITRCFQEIDLQDVLTSLVISVKRDIKEIEVGAFWAGKSLCVLPALEVTSDNATESCQIVAEFDDRPLLLVDGDPPALPWQYQQIAAVADPVKQPVFFLDDCRTQLFLWNMHECPGGRTVLAVDDSGGLFPCLPMLRGQQWCLGNIQTETHTYWSQVEDLKTRWRQARSTKCAKCLTEGWCSYCPAHEKEDAEAICAMKAAVWEQLT
jgi:radical SAM protein with 4Fe4S-binding SPASM domain